MKGRRWLLGALCILLSGSAAGGADRGVSGPHWLTDLGQARREARHSGKPIFVVFRCEH